MAAAYTLYSKSWCGWCASAKRTLQQLGITYTDIDVERTRGADSELRAISGQSKVPTLVVDAEGGRKVLADFGPEEVAPFLQKHGVVLP